jgi:transcriptional regulator with XRE-family HTH domain
MFLDKRRLTVRELAEALGVPQKTAQEWIGPKGRTPRKLEVLKQLASFFDCSVHFLLFGEEDPNGPDANAGLMTGPMTGRLELGDGVYEFSIRKIRSAPK